MRLSDALGDPSVVAEPKGRFRLHINSELTDTHASFYWSGRLQKTEPCTVVDSARHSTKWFKTAQDRSFRLGWPAITALQFATTACATVCASTVFA